MPPLPETLDHVRADRAVDRDRVGGAVAGAVDAEVEVDRASTSVAARSLTVTVSVPPSALSVERSRRRRCP